MRRGVVWSVIVGCALVWAHPALAVPPGAIKGRAISSNGLTNASGRNVVKTTNGAAVWSVSLFCPTAPCGIILFDSTSTTVGSGTIVWEGKASSNNSTFTQDFGAPLITSTGLAIETTGVSSIAFVSYE